MRAATHPRYSPFPQGQARGVAAAPGLLDASQRKMGTRPDCPQFALSEHQVLPRCGRMICPILSADYLLSEVNMETGAINISLRHSQVIRPAFHDRPRENEELLSIVQHPFLSWQ